MIPDAVPRNHLAERRAFHWLRLTFGTGWMVSALLFAFAMPLDILAPDVCAQTLPGHVDPTFRVQPGHYQLAGEESSLTRLELRYFEVSSPGKATERTHRAVTIFGPESRDRGRLHVYYDGMRRIRKFDGRIRDADGQLIRKLSRDDVQDFSAISDFSLYEDNRVRVAELYHDRYPYTVEFEVDILYDGLLTWPTWYPQLHGEAVEFGAMEIRTPSDVPMRYSDRNLNIEPKTSDDGRFRSYHWSVQMLPPFEEEDYGPSLLEQVGAIHTAPARFEIEGTFGDMSTWEGFGRWYASLSQDAGMLPQEALRDVLALAADAPNDLEKARRLYDYLQSRTRYVSVQLGLGGWKPYPAEYVHERRYGDCKALSNYMIALLRAVGLPAYPALIRTGRREPAILADFPSNQFNHAIAFVPLASDTLWLETTSQTIPFGHIGADNEDRYALVVTESGGKLIRTPQSSPEDNRQDRNGRIELSANGEAVATITTSYSGNQQDRLRRSLARASEKERRDWLDRTLDLPQFDVISADFGDVARGSTTVKLPVELRLPSYATRAGSRLFFMPALMERWTAIPPATDVRTQDVDYFSYAFVDSDTLLYALPEGYEVEAVPDTVSIETGFGRFESSSTLRDDGTLQFVRTFEVRQTRLPPDAFEAFRDFLTHVARSDRAQVVLVERKE